MRQSLASPRPGTLRILLSNFPAAQGASLGAGQARPRPHKKNETGESFGLVQALMAVKRAVRPPKETP
jgi:hypothetical protein